MLDELFYIKAILVRSINITIAFECLTVFICVSGMEMAPSDIFAVGGNLLFLPMPLPYAWGGGHFTFMRIRLQVSRAKCAS